MALDPLTNAVRRDLADIRLADRVFAPHYAMAMPRTIAAGAVLRAKPDLDSAQLAQLAAGDPFDVLELSGDHAWGLAVDAGLVGYIDSSALVP